MVKKNKIIGIISILALGVAIIVFANSSNTFAVNSDNEQTTSVSPIEEYDNLIVFEGKTDSFSNLKELEDESTIIVKGTKVENKDIVIYKSDINSNVIGGYTISNFEISQVYKNGNKNTKVKNNKIIPVVELDFYDKETGASYSVNGYKKMEINEEYLLFLTKEDENGLFATRGVTFGKVPLNNNKLEIMSDSGSSIEASNNTFSKIFDDARIKYK